MENALPKNVMRDALAAEGYAPIVEVSDGNCVFRALSRFIWGTPDYHERARTLLVTHVVADPAKKVAHHAARCVVMNLVQRMLASTVQLSSCNHFRTEFCAQGCV